MDLPKPERQSTTAIYNLLNCLKHDFTRIYIICQQYCSAGKSPRRNQIRANI